MFIHYVLIIGLVGLKHVKNKNYQTECEYRYLFEEKKETKPKKEWKKREKRSKNLSNNDGILLLKFTVYLRQGLLPDMRIRKKF